MAIIMSETVAESEVRASIMRKVSGRVVRVSGAFGEKNIVLRFDEQHETFGWQHGFDIFETTLRKRTASEVRPGDRITLYLNPANVPLIVELGEVS